MSDGQRGGSPSDGVPDPLRPDELDLGESELELVAEIWCADAREAREAARRAASIAALARRRGVERDAAFGPRGGPGVDARQLRPVALADVSETFVAELALIRQCTEAEAESLAVESIVLTTKLVDTWSALFEGRLDVRKMRAMVDLLGEVKESTAAIIQARVLPGAERLTVPQLREKVRRLLARLEAAALDKRRRDRVRRSDVHRWPVGDGMSQLVIDLTTPDAAACAEAIGQYADMLRADGDPRPIGLIRAQVARDLILRPWDTSRPPVTARLTIHAALPALAADSDEPAEIDGEHVTAAQCRELLGQLDMLGLRAAPAGGCVQLAIHHPATGRLIAVATRRELRRAALGSRRRRRRGTPPGRTTQSAAGGPGLRPPAPSPGYRIPADQRRFVTTRDRRCRMPGCRRRPGRCDIDHAVAHAAGGPTACWNLCCLCRRHHRIKTFARDWSFQLLADGRLIVRTPSGVSRITRPPGWCHDPEPDPPWIDEQAPPDQLLC
jgi:hypothetical protein